MASSDNSTSRASRPSSSRPSHIATMRQGFRQLFNGQSVVGTAPAPTRAPHPRVPDSPKTPRLNLDTFSASRFVLPHIARTSTSPSTSHTYVSPTMASISTSSPSDYSPTNYRPMTPNTFRALQPSASMGPVPPPPTRQNTAERLRQFTGADPEELVLVEAIARRDRRKPRQKRNRRQKKPRTPAPYRNPYLSRSGDRRLRRLTTHCIASGLLLVAILSLYLGFALSDPSIGQEFHVILILIILAITIFFTHAFISIILYVLKPRPAPGFIPDMDAMHVSPLGYATPRVPIPVTLARDEESLIGSRANSGVEDGKVAPPPPAYGLWRESVRMDPDRIFWARNTAAPPLSRRGSDASGVGGAGGAPRRPPSYVSDDGVEYVVQAAGRSIAPATDVPLPVHPSERGRLGGVPGGVPNYGAVRVYR